MNKYPGFIPPGSGSIKTVYAEYPFATPTHHLGPYNNMDWDKSKTSKPLSDYHPCYLHHINDSLLTLRDPANAATIELGVGKHIVDIARYANSNNLGYINQRLGVGYFKQLGVSGSASWWNNTDGLQSITVNSGLAVETVGTDHILIESGYFNGSTKFDIALTNTNVVFSSNGSGYIDTVGDYNQRWGFMYGIVQTLDNIKLLNNTISLYNSGSGIVNSLYDFTFKNNLLCTDLTMTRGIVSGLFDTYLRVGISDVGLVTYLPDGHNHDASGWLLPTSDYNITGNMIFDGRYYYAIGSNEILMMDNLSVVDSLIPYQSFDMNFHPGNRVYKDDSNLNVVNAGWVPATTAELPSTFVPKNVNDKVATLNELVIYGTEGEDVLNITDGRQFFIDGPIDTLDEFYFIDNFLYFVHVLNSQVYIYRFNGKFWEKWRTNIVGQFISSWVNNNDIFIASFTNQTLKVVRFNNLGDFKPVGDYQLFGNPRQVTGLDHDLVCLVKDYSNIPLDRYHLGGANAYSVYVYNLNNPGRYQKLFYNMMNSKLCIYNNTNYIYVQVGDIKRKISRNKSANLSLDAIGGLYDARGNINVVGSMKTKSVVTGLCADSLFVDLIPIYQHLFLLEPGRLDDSPFEYTGDFKDTYISRYVYNTVISDAHTYNDITCSIVFNNTYYFGHRGDISAFLKTGDKFNEPVPTRLAHQIVAKFLPLDNSLYALVQDFNSGLVDYIWGPPTSPYASETDNTNYVPFLPGPWSVPVTKLYRKALNQNSWSEDTKFTQQFGLNLIDAISHDNNIYVIAHDRTGSGILSAKYAAGNPDVSGILLSFSGGLLLNESLIGSNMAGTSLFEFVPTTDGRFESVSGIYPTGVIADLNGHHEFYLYNHPAGPYVVHDQVEFLYENISPSSIYPWRSSDKYEVQGYVMKNMGDRYSYRTLGITFLKQELPRPPRLGNPLDIPIQIYPVDVNTPNIKITIAKDHPLSVSQSDETNKYVMKDRSVDSACNRNHIHFITSVTHNKVIYLLVQVDQVMKIYAVRDFGDYIYKIPPIGGNPDANAASGVSTVFGETSYAGIKTYTNFVPSGTFNSGKAGVPFFLDFVPCDLNNTFVTEFNINDIVGFNPGSVYILGDGDDLFIQKPLSKKYKNNKRFATHSTMAVGSNIYVPITCRVDHPTGRLYTFVLGFFSDGSIGLVDNQDAAVQLLNKPTGRAQIQFKDGKYVISAMKMTDDSQEYISYRDIQNDPVWGKTILDTIPDQFSKIYNPNASKKWIIGEYDIKIEDNLNVRENF